MSDSPVALKVQGARERGRIHSNCRTVLFACHSSRFSTTSYFLTDVTDSVRQHKPRMFSRFYLSFVRALKGAWNLHLPSSSAKMTECSVVSTPLLFLFGTSIRIESMHRHMCCKERESEAITLPKMQAQLATLMLRSMIDVGGCSRTSQRWFCGACSSTRCSTGTVFGLCSDNYHCKLASWYST